MFNIEEELKKLPARPGVYIMHDDKDAIIYVGKAISLKNRVRQYFQSSRNKTVKIEQMVTKIRRFEYIVTDTEVEALVLECNLIKEHRPKYNTMLTDDKTYPFIRVTINEAFPRIMLSRTMKKDKSKYFGPYTSGGAVKDTIDLIQKIYKIRTCNRNLPRDINKARPCLNYHIKQCNAPCQGYITEEEYAKSIMAVLDFLNGNLSEVEGMLEKKMLEASENMEFETAIEYRDLLNSVKQIAQKQKITNSDFEDKDVIALSRDGNDGVIQVFFIRSGRLIGREHFHMNISINDKKGQIISSFIKQFYSGTPYIPKELMIQEEIEDMELIEQWLSKRRGQKVYVRVPKKGTKEKLVELAEKNAAMVLTKDKDRIKVEEKRTTGAMKEIEELLGLSEISRVEAFDISNISGYQSVGSMIVYENGNPRRSDYRKFKIKSVSGPDDYASMNEVLTRRFTHGIEEMNTKEAAYDSFTKFPDLIMMDGGRGQVNIASKVLDELKLSIPVCGMVKDDNHRTRGLYYQNKEIPINKNSEGFKLITRIQDEAHRFAIEYHRSLRSKGQVHSILDDIGGIGATRRKALMQRFASIEDIKNAEVETLTNVAGMTETAAKSVYDFFHKVEK
ncbi:excinuclease ABC subunit UvrC [Lachnotalea glycerini]|uniref:UvrABC system protein C n=1 Tax=Lachnotalea glycerini TaxID=1763509 RepID=A0A371JB04_9FIRM|nr:excinuclease ABC subunit UvrC [Lachnotalea glycerini]RDY29848.1 excinuclease ABC subunit UvrC [Lachnotalea glycerini]